MPGFFDRIISILFLVLFSYQAIYIFASFFLKEREDSSEFRYHDLAVLICARNEENVIADLLASIRSQTYPKEHVHTFVMADNCDDLTAHIAEENGATVYERRDPEHVGKGYALEELMSRIGREYGEAFDAYIVIDADNLLKEDFLEQMNRSYCKGNRIIAGYISAKNYDDNWISAGYSLFLLHKNRFLNNARYLLGLNCAINGTGFLFDRKLIRQWDYHTLTEDIELSVDQACRHHRIAYCKEAVVYDEQPVSLRQSFYQRVRWAKGYLQVIGKYTPSLLKGIREGDFSCYDMLNTILSAYGMSVFCVTLKAVTLLSLVCLGRDIAPYLYSILLGLLKAYMMVYLSGLMTVLAEWKRIDASAYHKILYTFTYPLFLATYVPIAVYALFAKVTWVPIRHGIRSSNESSC